MCLPQSLHSYSFSAVRSDEWHFPLSNRGFNTGLRNQSTQYTLNRVPNMLLLWFNQVKQQPIPKRP
ncbi:hypothetical protein LXL04_026896 [Taraxacum kok-saghyz]